MKTERAARPQVRRQGEDRRRTGRQAQERSGGDLMATPPHRRTRQQVAQGRDSEGAHRRERDRSARCTLLVAGKGCRAVAEAPPSSPASRKVLLADDARLRAHAGASRWRRSLSLRRPTTRSWPPRPATGKNFMPRVAALLDVMQVSDIIKVWRPTPSSG